MREKKRPANSVGMVSSLISFTDDQTNNNLNITAFGTTTMATANTTNLSSSFTSPIVKRKNGTKEMNERGLANSKASNTFKSNQNQVSSSSSTRQNDIQFAKEFDLTVTLDLDTVMRYFDGNRYMTELIKKHKSMDKKYMHRSCPMDRI
jgi:hypothetical protein